MIYESYPYFENLENYTKKYENVDLGPFNEEQEEEYLCELERDTFYAAFVVRKLIESRKVADSFKDQKIALTRYNSIASNDSLVGYKIDKRYDLSENNAHNEMKDISFICNQLVHSKNFVFCFNTEEINGNANIGDQVIGFFINSDYTARKKLYYVSWQNWIAFIQSVRSFHVDSIHCFRRDDGTIVEHKFNSKMDYENEIYKKIVRGL